MSNKMGSPQTDKPRGFGGRAEGLSAQCRQRQSLRETSEREVIS